MCDVTKSPASSRITSCNSPAPAAFTTIPKQRYGEELSGKEVGTGRARCEVTDAVLACVDVLVDGEFMKDKKTRDPSQEQLLDREFKTSDGESAEKTRRRMNKFFDKILKEYEGKRIAVISHRRFHKIFLTKLVRSK